MNQLNRFIIAATAALAMTSAHADKRIERTIDCSDKPLVHVINAIGDIEVVGKNTDTCRLDAWVSERVQRIDIKERGDRIKIEVIYDKDYKRGGGTTLELVVPKDIDLKVGGVSSSVEVVDVNGSLSLQSVSGDVEATSSSPKIYATTTSGDVEIYGEGQDGKFQLSSTSGSVEADGLAGYLTASAVSGGVEVSDSNISYGRFEVVSGSIEATDAFSPNSDVEAEAVSGSIEVTLNAGFAGTIDVTTLTGRIKNCFGPKPQKTSRYGPGRTLSFEHGDKGDGRLTASSINGSVYLCLDD
ncbi:MAG: DUF4097 family beta strand repeat-containing protein [Pseudomonadota bacterium]